MMIDFANLKETHREQQAEIEEAMISIARNAQYIMGQEVSGLETELAAFVGEGRAIACSSGSSALLLAILALGLAPGDEVITTPFSFIASSSMPALLGIKPVFVDILPDDFNIDPAQIESAITPKTKAILAVSLYGQPPNLEQLEQIAQRQDLRLIIDGAQSFGATCNKRKDSVFGDIATTSFFPSKPLGCYGDGGAVFTRNEELAERLFSLHLHGQSERYVHPLLGINGRLDSLQAAVLRIKLRIFEDTLARRNKVAQRYSELLEGCGVVVPRVCEGRTSSWAQYTLRVPNRDALAERLHGAQIPTAVHYPLGLHLQECFKSLGHEMGDFPETEKASAEVLSLPMNPYLSEEQIQYIVQTLKDNL
ncbi:MAG: DegT/DnrJ/EryC1/StrS family aminotransferase [Helicobacter sp.]|nr:DegT/DnrJ/EryC1/StrS family aminotransferase [Helicobacter sp.]